MPVSVSPFRWGSGVALVATGALTGGLLLAAPAHAKIEYGSVRAGGSVSSNGTPTSGTCTPTNAAQPASKTFTDNGVAVRQSQSRTSTLKWSGNANDVITAQQSGAMTVKAMPITAGGGRIDFSGSAAFSASPKIAASKCRLGGSASLSAGADFVLPVGMWATLNGSANSVGSADVSVSIYRAESNSSGLRITVGGSKANGATAAYLPAGSYYADAEFYAYGSTRLEGATVKPVAASVSGSGAISFTPGGAASPVTGKGARFVALGARSCVTNAVSAGVTTKARKRAAKVVIKVNGARKVTLKGKKLKRASAVSLAGLAPTSNVNVVATITPKKGKKVTVARSYRACR